MSGGYIEQDLSDGARHMHRALASGTRSHVADATRRQKQRLTRVHRRSSSTGDHGGA